MEWSIIGIIAALLTTFGFVPQIIKMFKSKSSHDISVVTLLQFAAGTGLWTIYGIHINDLIIIGANTVSFMTIIVAILVFYHFRSEKKK